jgi:hypothetical protein
LRKLDDALARFFDALERRVGPVRVLLSGDHGTVPTPESRLPFPAYCTAGTVPAIPYELPRCVRGGRLEPTAIGDELRRETEGAIGPGAWVTGIADGYVFLTDAARRLEGPRRRTVDQVVRRVFLDGHRDDTAEVFDTRELSARCPAILAGARGAPDRARPGEDLLTLVCRSFRPDAGAGDYYVVPKYGSFWDGELVPGKGSSHGTPYLYDRTVPLLVRGAPGELDAGGAIDDPVDFATSGWAWSRR